MNLNETLDSIAEKLNVSAADLKAYAAEDTVGGYHPDPAQRQWDTGSIWAVEGKIMYAIVRALKPTHCIELGTHHGCSAAHIATALAKNGSGTLTCVDLRLPIYARDSPSLRAFQNVTVVQDEGVGYIEKSKIAYDFVFEDLMHSETMTAAIWNAASDNLSGGGVIISHDALHYIVGHEVRAGIEHVTDEAHYYLTDPSDCGLAIWQKPNAPKAAYQVERHAYIPADSIPVPEKETQSAPKKTKRRRKAKATS